MNNRLKEIDDIVNSIKPENEYQNSILKKIDKFKKDFSKELEEYIYVPTILKFKELKPGGYVRYINYDNEIKYGGILVKVFESETKDDFNKKNLLLLQNSNGKQWVVSWEKNYIFYKRQTKRGDNLRKLFISLLDKKTD